MMTLRQALAALLLTSPLLAGAVPHAAQAQSSPDPDQYTVVARGRALATAGDCVACHTASGGAQFAGGQLLQTPFGPISTPNLTPDDETGLGKWTADDFYKAMHTGIAADGSHLYPAFPYTSYTKVSRADTDAIFAFLRTVPPVHNAVNRSTLPFPFDIRTLMVGWNTMFFTPGEFKPDPAKSAEYNRGAYLVEGLAHCSTCHTQMNWAGANKDAAFLQGNKLDNWVDPNITNDAHAGLGSWSADEIVEYLKTGRNAHGQASGPMAEVVEDSTSLMPAADLHAIAVYLKEHGAAGPAAPAPVAASDAQMQAGAAVYTDNCMACHKPDGTGIPHLFPALAGSQVVQQTDPATLAHIVVAGARAAATDAAVTAPAMPSFGWRLSDQQVADVLTYVRNSWGNAAPAVTAGAVQSVRAAVGGATVSAAK